MSNSSSGVYCHNWPFALTVQPKYQTEFASSYDSFFSKQWGLHFLKNRWNRTNSDICNIYSHGSRILWIICQTVVKASTVITDVVRTLCSWNITLTKDGVVGTRIFSMTLHKTQQYCLQDTHWSRKRAFYVYSLWDVIVVSAAVRRNVYLIILWYALSEYDAVHVRSADIHDIGGVILDSSFSIIVDVRLCSQPSSKF